MAARTMTRLRRREELEGYLYISPWILGFFIFVLGPMIASIYLSLTHYNLIEPPRFVGFRNYVYMVSEDELFWGSLGRTLYYAGVSIPLGVTGSLLLALLLDQQLRGTAFFRTVFFLPHLTPIVASVFLWKWILQPQVGLMNYLLGKIGIDGPGWLVSQKWAIPALIVMSLWRGMGGNRMIIFLAGLQGIPEELYEAAMIDGAGVWRRFVHVTVPMLTPTIFFNMIVGVIGGLKVFTSAFVATEGGPGHATYFYVLHLYNKAFAYAEMGFASALAWAFFVVVLSFTLIQVVMSRRWVFYGGEVTG